MQADWADCRGMSNADGGRLDPLCQLSQQLAAIDQPADFGLSLNRIGQKVMEAAGSCRLHFHRDCRSEPYAGANKVTAGQATVGSYPQAACRAIVAFRLGAGGHMPERDFDYWRRRADEEAAAARRATNAAAAKAHRKLADQYADIAESKRSLAGTD
jgi:hypothetical protein